METQIQASMASLAQEIIIQQLQANFLLSLPTPKGPVQAGQWRLRKTVSPIALEAHRRANVETATKLRKADLIRSMELDGPQWMAGT